MLLKCLHEKNACNPRLGAALFRLKHAVKASQNHDPSRCRHQPGGHIDQQPQTLLHSAPRPLGARHLPNYRGDDVTTTQYQLARAQLGCAYGWRPANKTPNRLNGRLRNSGGALVVVGPFHDQLAVSPLRR